MSRILSTFIALCFFTAFALAKPPCYAAKSPLWVTPQNGSQAIKQAIVQAKQSIEIATYTFTDRSVIHALSKAAKQGIHIRVLVDRAPYQANNINLRAIHALKKAGIQVETSNPQFKNMHEKTMIIDHQIAYLMTGNFTYSGFHFQRNFILALNQTALVKEIEQVFNADWQHRTPILHASALVWSPENHGRWIIQLIQHAKTSLAIYAPGFGSKRFMNALTNRAKNGVHITLITRPKNSAGYKRLLQTLQAAGIQLVYMQQPILHAKMIIADKRLAYLGSNNFTSTSFHHNRELGILICNKKLIQQLENIFSNDAARHKVMDKK